MDSGILEEYMVPVIIGICLCVGYVVKKWVKDVNNRYIPTICCALGILLAIWMNGGQAEPGVILSGMVSGLASTGMHQAVTRLFENEAPENLPGTADL